MNKILLGVVVGLTLGINGFAQTDDSREEAATLDTIVVTATKSPRFLSDVAGTVTAIDQTRLSEEMIQNIDELVRYEPGLSTPRSSARFGSEGFSIRGVKGNRVAIELDGIPVGDQFSIGSFSNAGRDLVDLSFVKRVEILRGPASTLYGSDAIGGIVAYSTWNPSDLAKERNQPAFRITSGFFDKDETWANLLQTAIQGERIGAFAAIRHRRGSQPDNFAAQGLDDVVDYEQVGGFGKLTWESSTGNTLALILDAQDTQRDTEIRSILGTGRFRSTSALAGDDVQRRNRASLHGDFDVDRLWADQASVKVYWQHSETDQITREERLSRGIRRERQFEYSQRNTGLKLNLTKDVSGNQVNHRIGYGFDAQLAKTEELRMATEWTLSSGIASNNILSEQFPLRDFPVSKIREFGLYVHDEISTDSRWTVIPAIRVDRYDLDPKPDQVYRDDNPETEVVSIRENAISPKLGVVYDLNESWSLFGQYARGFRAPPFEDANIGLDIPLFNIRAIPNPELRSEYSNGFEAGVRMFARDTVFTFTTFYTDYKDFIETKVNLGPDPETGLILFQSQNIDSTHIYGSELRFERTLDFFGRSELLHISTALNWTRGTNDVTGQPLNSVEPAEGVLGLRLTPPKLPLELRFFATLVDGKSRVDQTRSDAFVPGGFALFDVIAKFEISNKLVLRGAVNNITDKKYWRWSNVQALGSQDPLIDVLAAPGRNYSISLDLNL